MTANASPTRIKTNKVFEYLNDSDKRITSLRGGTRSGKTYNVLIWFIVKYLQETGKVLTIARETMPALKGSAMRDFFEILDTLGIYDEQYHNKTNNEYLLNGNLVEFVGLSESARIRGRKRDDAFINEINETSLDAFRQLAFRTKRKIVCDYNPSEAYSWVYDDIETRRDCEVYVTTYQDNPFLEPEIVAEIEMLQEADQEYWNVYGLGQIGSGNSRIYSHWKAIDNSAWPHNRGERIYGIDFGFNNATAVVEITFYDNTLHWREVLYQTKLTNTDLIEKLKEIPTWQTETFIADCAEPQRIEEMHRAGFDARPAFKLVKDTIDFVKSKPLRVHASSSNLLREIKRYSWKTDKNGNLTDDVVKFDDHALDAARYGSYHFNEPTSMPGYEVGGAYPQAWA